MKIMGKIATAAAALAVLGAGVSAQQAGQEVDSARSDRGEDSMRMMQDGQMRGEPDMRGMMRMMSLMRDCMHMMDSMAMEMGGSSMDMSRADSREPMREGPGAALRHGEELDLSAEQVDRLEDAREEWRQAREDATARLREAHEVMKEAAEAARERTRETLTSEQHARPSEMAGGPMEECPMNSGGGASDAAPAPGEGRDS